MLEEKMKEIKCRHRIDRGPLIIVGGRGYSSKLINLGWRPTIL